MSSQLAERDLAVIWHPYSQHGLNQKILPVVSAKGAYLTLADGSKILDGISSWWVNIHGHSHPDIVEAISTQAAEMEHVIFSGFTHEPAVQLAEALVAHPAIRACGLTRVFYSDNGSTAVEVALKMAYQYPLNQGKPSRNRFLALHSSYHGDTLGAMAVGEPSGFHSQFRRLMPEVDFVEPGNLEAFRMALEQRGSDYAAFIFEPLIQGAGGMRIYESEFLQEAVRLCKERGVLTICDEVFTGFYRTGECFAFQHAGIQPDLLCLSKGITGGFLPLAVTLATSEIFSGFLSQDMRTAFLHGHSYTANPIACAAGLASWKILQLEECQLRIQVIAKHTKKNIERLQSRLQGSGVTRVRDARYLGTIGAVEIEDPMNYFSSKPRSLMDMALERGVLLRPLGNVLYAVPPYCCTGEEIDRIYQVMGEVLDRFLLR